LLKYNHKTLRELNTILRGEQKMYFEFTEKKYYINADEKEKDYSLIESQFKTLIKKHHPDNGGDHSIFVLLPDEKDKILNKIESTRIIDNETYEIEKLIRANDHPNYPNYSKAYAKQLWNYYSYLYKFHKNFSEINKDNYEEVGLLTENLDINIAFPLYEKFNSYKVLICFNSNRKGIDRNIDSIFQNLRKKIKNNYPGLNFTFIVNCGGPIQTF